MSKRSRHADNSKRQQPSTQQRAQANLPGTSRSKAVRTEEIRNTGGGQDRQEDASRRQK